MGNREKELREENTGSPCGKKLNDDSIVSEKDLRGDPAHPTTLTIGSASTRIPLVNLNWA